MDSPIVSGNRPRVRDGDLLLPLPEIWSAGSPIPACPGKRSPYTARR
jgi:hypothetical protein